MSDDKASQGISVGPFDLLERIGSGGMGEVWRAAHRRTGTPSAVKLITSDFARDERFRATFHREARAMARLDHPLIVRILDYGQVEEATQQATSGRFLVGSPYVAMEMAPDGTLLDVIDRGYGWPDIHKILGSVLDALAHSHSRGLLHRDIKPENLLAAREGGLRRWKLTDFGLAQSIQAIDADRPEQVAGTPAYMAPEQFAGDWRDLGPPTDLYALGVMGYQLAAGRLPFDEDIPLRLAHMHMREEPERLEPRFDVPEAFIDWIHCLLQKDPARRFAKAADAAHALSTMEVESSTAFTSIMEIPTGAPTQLSSQSTLPTPEEWPEGRKDLGIDTKERLGFAATRAFQRIPSQLDSSAPSRADFDLPDPIVAPTWRRDDARASHSLAAVSPRLYGLKRVPMVGRDSQRDALWSQLEQVAQTGRPRLVVVDGPAGCGKSRLARWLVERADELGAANTMRATHSREAGREDGLGGMLARWGNLTGLDGDRLRERLAALIGVGDDAFDWLVEDIATLRDSVDPESAQRSSKMHSVWELIRRTTSQRPLVVWLDDLQWGGTTLAFLEFMQAQDFGDAPVLFCATVQSEALAEEGAISRRVAGLLDADWTSRLTLDALTMGETRELVGALLSLDNDLALRVSRRVDGNPLFAVQLVGDWLERGWLVADEGSFRLRENVQPDLPDSLHSVWRDRIARLLRRRTPDDALKLAAILGRNVDTEEWRAACRERWVEARIGLVEELVELKLAEPTESGWRFVHGMLRESLLRQARESNQWASLNTIAAMALRDIAEQRDAPRYAGRIGRLLIDAGEYEAAVEYILEGARHAAADGDHAVALELVGRLEEACAHIDADTREVQGRGQLARARALSGTGSGAEAIRITRGVHQLAEEHGWRRLSADSLELWCQLEHGAGRVRDAARLARRFLEVYEEIGDVTGSVRARLRLGDNAAYAGELDDAMAHYARALELAEEHDMPPRIAWAHWGIGYVLQQQLRLDEATPHLHEAMEGFRGAGQPQQALHVLAGLADIDRMTGRYERAEQRTREVLEAVSSKGGRSAILSLNMAVICLMTDRVEEASTWAQRAESIAPQADRAWPAIHAMQLALGSARADMQVWDARFERLQSSIRETGFVDIDMVFVLGKAASSCRDADMPERASTLSLFVADMWDRLGFESRAAAARRVAGQSEASNGQS
jgi:serine/threonine protein kinase/tetratricopeptide (TPR) repeat protein